MQCLDSILRDSNFNRGGEKDFDCRRLSSPYKAALDETGGEKSEENKTENQEQSMEQLY